MVHDKGFLSAGSRLHKLFKLLPDFGYGFLPFISGGSVVCVCCLDVFYDLVNVFMDDVIEIILSVYLCDFKGSHIKVIQVFCDQIEIPYEKLTSAEFTAFLGILRKSKSKTN